LSPDLMPAGAVEHDHGVSAWGDLVADLLKVQVHGPGVGLGNHPCGADASGRTDGSEQIGPGIALVAWRPRPAAPFGPDAGQRALLADASLVLPPDLQGPAARRLRDGLRDQIGEVFLCAVAASGS